jgi:CO/xanthine dehydrogenase FAD-binding subunit
MLEARLAGLMAEDAVGAIVAEDFGVLDPIDDVRASGAYRRHAAEALVRDLLGALATAPARRAA